MKIRTGERVGGGWLVDRDKGHRGVELMHKMERDNRKDNKGENKLVRAMEFQHDIHQIHNTPQ